MNYGELNLQRIPQTVNPTNGQFLKGKKPFNKGVPMSEWMDGRKIKRVLKGLNRNGRKDIGGWNKKSVVAIKDGKFMGQFNSSQEAGKRTGIQSRNIRKVCNKERNKAGKMNWFFESDNSWHELLID